jgi:hypothetical protein
MEILKHHVWNLKSILKGVSKDQVHSRLRQHTQSMTKWTDGENSGDPAYPGLQTEEGFNHFIELKERMYEAIQTGNFTELDDKKADDLCRSCGNLTENGCRLRGKCISIR